MVHYFLVNVKNDSAYYRLGVFTSKSANDVEKYLNERFYNVSFRGSKVEPTKFDTGTKVCPVGILCYCKFFGYFSGFSDGRSFKSVYEGCSDE